MLNVYTVSQLANEILNVDGP